MYAKERETEREIEREKATKKQVSVASVSVSVHSSIVLSRRFVYIANIWRAHNEIGRLLLR